MSDNGSSSSAGFEKLIFQQELNEVYLLLDYISGQPSRQLSDLNEKIVDPKDIGRKLKTDEIVQRVSELRYPLPAPQPGITADQAQEQKGKDAAFLLLLKDSLNTLAHPARGLTIAYTILFSETSKNNKTSRLGAAELAFPGLVISANRFRTIKGILAWSGLFVTVVAALLLWQVTYGAQLAAHYDQAKINDTQTAAAIYNELDKQPNQKAIAGTIDLTKFCKVPDATTPSPDAREALASVMNSTIRQLCDQYAYRHALFCVAIYDIGRYSSSPSFEVARRLLPLHDIKNAQSCGEQDSSDMGRQEDAQSVAGVLAMMSNYLLPILFGLVGTMAALVRGIQDKVTDSILLPRDQALSLIRLPLGMVAGVSVGLFLTPSNVMTQTAGTIGAFTISASGVAFLAGYGAEAFFGALDILISRVFTLNKESRPIRP